MIAEYYRYIQFAVWVLLLVTGSYLLIGKVPNKAIFNTYKKSRKFMGIAFGAYCIQFFLQWKFNVRDDYPLVASALNVTFFYLASIFLSFSFISLLKERYLNRSRVISSIATWSVISAIVWFSIFFLSEKIVIGALAFSALWLFVYVTHISWLFFKTYRRAVKKIQNYYSEETDRFIRWISRSVFFAIFMGLLCPAMAFAPKWMITIYLISSIPFFFYIFVGFVDYLINYETVDVAIEEEESSTESSDTSLPFQTLEANLQEWITAKGYLQTKINLTELAKRVNSNRSYLSNYINSAYSCTFYEWIVKLRVEEAKELLLSNPEFTLTQIAEMVGFSSCSHFTAKFTEKEKVSPATWRENRKAKILSSNTK